MAARKSARARPRIYETTDVEKTRGADGRPIKVGHVVRRPVQHHPVLGTVPSAVGRVVRVYIDHLGRTLVDAYDRGLRTFAAKDCKRSQARVEAK